MGIFSRLNTVIRSNLNALVDRAEDPEKMIQQTVLDMKEEVKRARQELVSTLGTSKRLEKKKLELETELASWEEKAVLALRSGDESLAREALKRKAKTKKDAEEAGRQAAMAATAADQMQATLDKVEQKIRDLETRQSSLAAQVRKGGTDLHLPDRQEVACRLQVQIPVNSCSQVGRPVTSIYSYFRLVPVPLS